MFLIFDTETTGVPKNYNAPLTDFDNWPRVVQIAWQLHDESGKLLTHRNLIIRPEGFTIPFNAEKIHGISTQRAMDEGRPLAEVLDLFLSDLERATYVAGHNIGFDTNIMGCEFLRLNRVTPFDTKKVLDTMTLSTDFCAIAGGRGGKFKWPSLTELHQKLFGQPFGDAHDAAYDVEATTRCFFGLIEHRVIPIPEITDITGIQYEAPVLTMSNFKAREEQLTPEESNAEDHPSEYYSGFVHLHAHSQFSLLQSTADVSSMIKKAKEFATEEFPAVIALTDHANMMGAFQFVNDAWKKEVKAIVGCEFNICNDMRDRSKQDNGYQIPIIAKSKRGYQNLTKLSSLAFTDGFFYVPRIDKATLLLYAEDLIILSGGIFGEIGGRLLEEGEAKAEEAFAWWNDNFKDHFYVELNRHGLDEEEYINRFNLTLCEKYAVPYVAANSAYYIDRKDSQAQDTLVCIKEGESLSTPKKYTNKRTRDFRWGLPNDEYYLKSPAEMSRLFADLPEALSNTRAIADRCEAYKLTRDVLLPKFDIPAEFQDPQDDADGGKRGENNYLRHLTYAGAKKRYSEISDEIQQRLDFELATIANTGYPGYFLIVQDFCNKARELGVSVGPGRGSAAGSAVAYCTGITNVDPIRYQLLFERFLNPERVSLPDIDIDFDDEGRDRVIQYVRDKYGANMVSQIITYGTMKGKSAIRDAGRVMGLPLPETDKIAKCMPDNTELSNILHWDEKKLGNELSGEDFVNAKVLRMKANEQGPEAEVIRLAASIEGSVRNTGIHACGVIITPDEITNYVPVATAKDSDMWCTQFDNSVVESAGLLKMDFLGLKTLTLIKDTIRIIAERHNIDIDIEAIPIDDEMTYQLFQRGHTSGIFQYESDGMQKYMKELKPTVFEDLIAMNALYRPGPLEYIPDFVKRKNGLQPITYDLPEMEEFLKDTYGITVYQEQVMLLSQKLANFSKGEADVLRKAMGKKQKDVLDKMKGKFMEGAKSNGHPEDKLEKIWTDWEAFASYAFNKSHSTCYAWIAYQTAYLKAHYPAEYMAAVLSNNMDNLKTVTQYMQECKKQNIVVLGPDVKESMALFSVNQKGEIRFGLAAIKGVGEPAVKAIIEERKAGTYTTMYDFFARMDSRAANRRTLENLVLAGALDSFGHDRSVYFAPDAKQGTFIEVMMQYARAFRESKNSSQPSLFGEATMTIQEPQLPKTEPWDTMTRLSKEKEVVGMYISAHPLDDFLTEIDAFCDKRGLSSLAQLSAIKGQELRLGVIVTSFVERTSQKTNKPYCIFTAEDFESSHEFKIFGDDYIKFRKLLSVGDKIMLQGMAQSYKFAQSPNELEFKITRIEPLFKVRELFANYLDITIPINRLSDELVDRIASTIQNGQGKAQVRMKIQTPTGDLNLESNQFDRVSVDPEALHALQLIAEVNIAIAEK